MRKQRFSNSIVSITRGSCIGSGTWIILAKNKKKETCLLTATSSQTNENQDYALRVLGNPGS